jgi:ABC-type nitrate/sulfonate/bicarbonate transport system substrate-binding protein
LVEAVVAATEHGYEFAEENPDAALDDLLAANPELERSEQQAQLKVLLPILHPAPFDPAVLKAWAAWDLKHGLLEAPLDVEQAFHQVG